MRWIAGAAFAASFLFASPDRIEPVVGARQVSGGPGSDVLEATAVPSESSISYDGGPGFDTVGWPFSTGVEADLEADEALVHHGTAGSWSYPILGIEGVYGSESGSDVLLGDEGTNVFYGGTVGVPFAGSTPDGDRIDGRGGDDKLYGDDGNDELDGGDGEDLIDGGDHVDTCRNGESVS